MATVVTNSVEYNLEVNGRSFQIEHLQIWDKHYPLIKRWETKINGIPKYTSHPNRWRTTMPTKKEMVKHLELYDSNYIGWEIRKVDGKIVCIKDL